MMQHQLLKCCDRSYIVGRSLGTQGTDCLIAHMRHAEVLLHSSRLRDGWLMLQRTSTVKTVFHILFHHIPIMQTLWWCVVLCAARCAVKMTKAQERLEMLRREKEEAEVRECTFKPQISGRSEKLMTERSQTLRSLNVSAHQQLYQDAIRRQQK